MPRLRPLLLPLLLAASPALLVAGDAVDAYQLDRTEVEQSVMGAFRGGWFPFDVTPALRSLPPDQRAGAVRALGEFTRSYVTSPGFKSEYLKAWKANKPHGFGLPSLDAKALAKKALDQSRGSVESAPAALDKDPDVTLRRRLQEFLDLTADVDYAAKTSGPHGTGTFVDESYEAKPTAWKMCYRAGREAGEAARAFATDWLAELSAAKK
jgi:hypothetical protein